MNIKPRILSDTDSYVTRYPQAIKIAEEQAAIIWFPTELGVEKDESDVRMKLTEGERHGLTTVLKLFTQYELMLGGEEFWGGKVNKMFPRPEIQRMAATFSFIELGVHAPFYNLINEVLGLSTDEFYTSWQGDPILVDRMEFIEKYAEESDPLISTAAFAFMEGAVLFSSFAYLKSLNSGGFNMCSHIVSGIDASCKDENQHSMASAWLFNQTKFEMKELGLLSESDIDKYNAIILNIASKVFEHESRIIDLIFSKGDIRTITKSEMLEFVKNRIDEVLGYLEISPLYSIKQGKVSEWFYNALSAYKYSDFFANQQIQYTRNWNKNKLAFKLEEE